MEAEDETPRRTTLEDPCISRNQAAIWWDEARLHFEVEVAPHGRLKVLALVPVPRPQANQAPYQVTEIAGRVVLQPGSMLMLSNRVLLSLSHRRVDTPPSYGMLGQSEAMEDLRRHIQKIGRFPETVLLLGEVGSGKEMVAQALHKAGERSGPLEAINMANLNPNLCDAELFGHEVGAFTDARRRHAGAFERAHNGTLFMDEIRDVPLDVQSRLLRALENRTYQPLGAQTARQITARIVAASNRSLTQAVAQGEFRQDLLDRLRALTITVPPLRERREDIPLLLVAFLRTQTQQHPELQKFWPTSLSNESPHLPLKLILDLMARHWEGNVRALLNYVNELAVANLNAPTFVQPNDFNDDFLGDGPPQSASPPPLNPNNVTAREELLEFLRAHDFNQTHAARALGITRQALIQRMNRANIGRSIDLDREEILQALQAHNYDLNATAHDLHISTRSLSTRINQLGLNLKDD